jgi:hypothetical protein
MKRVAILVLAAAWTAMAGNALAQGQPRHGGGDSGRQERMERRQPPPPPPQQPGGNQRNEPGGQRMSPEERRQLRDDIRQHSDAYRGRDRRP